MFIRYLRYYGHAPLEFGSAHSTLAALQQHALMSRSVLTAFQCESAPDGHSLDRASEGPVSDRPCPARLRSSLCAVSHYGTVQCHCDTCSGIRSSPRWMRSSNVSIEYPYEVPRVSIRGSGLSQVEVPGRTVLYCTVLYCAVLCCAVLYCTVLYCTVLHCTVLYCTVLYCTVLYTVLCSLSWCSPSSAASGQ